ncbi:MAG: YgjV family protein [Bacteroidales bacterium]|jgi:hypothetical protein
MSSTLIQVVGFIGLIFFVFSFQQKNRNSILLLMIFGQLIFLIHFVLLGAWTAVGMNTVGMIRTVVFRFREKTRWANWRFWPVVFITLFIAAGLLANESWTGLLPVIAMSIETTGLWLKNLRKLRFINLFPHPFWFTYNLLMGSWAGVVCEIFVFSSVVLAIFRYDLKRVAPPE